MIISLSIRRFYIPLRGQKSGIFIDPWQGLREFKTSDIELILPNKTPAINLVNDRMDGHRGDINQKTFFHLKEGFRGGWWGSNPQHLVPQTSALPLSYSLHIGTFLF